MIRTLLVEDEPPGLLRLRQLAELEPDVVIVGEASTGREAVDRIAMLAPDLVLLDVRLPDMSGVDVLRAIPPEQRPPIIFVTAFDAHAVQAFELHALDYLLKPVEAERFRSAIARARSARTTLAHLHAAFEALLQATPAAARQRIRLEDNRRSIFVAPEEIDWIEAAANYVKVHAGERTYIHRGTLARCLAELGSSFVRVHRGICVNTARIRAAEPIDGGDYTIFLTDGTPLRMSRTYRAALEARIGPLR